MKCKNCKHGKEFYCEECYQENKGYSKGEWSEKAKEGRKGKGNPNWKGDEVGLCALHQWIRIRLPQPLNCEGCNILTPNLDLANISQKYFRRLDDWEYLCRRCHMNKDGRVKNLNTKKCSPKKYPNPYSFKDSNHNPLPLSVPDTKDKDPGNLSEERESSKESGSDNHSLCGKDDHGIHLADKDPDTLRSHTDESGLDIHSPTIDKDPEAKSNCKPKSLFFTQTSGSDIPLIEKVLKQHWVRDYDGKKQDVVMIKDVAEAVRKLKEDIEFHLTGIDCDIEYIKLGIIDKIFGEFE